MFPIRGGDIVQKTKKCVCGRTISLSYFRVMKTFRARNNREARWIFARFKKAYRLKQIPLERVGYRIRRFSIRRG